MAQLSGEVEEAAQERREAEEKAKKTITDVRLGWGWGCQRKVQRDRHLLTRPPPPLQAAMMAEELKKEQDIPPYWRQCNGFLSSNRKL